MPWEAREFDPGEIGNVTNASVEFLAIPEIEEDYVQQIVKRLQSLLIRRASIVAGRDCCELFEKGITAFTKANLRQFYRNFEEDYDGTMFSFINLALNATIKDTLIVLTEEYPFTDIELEALWRYALCRMTSYDATLSEKRLSAIGKDISEPLIFMFNKHNLSSWYQRTISPMVRFNQIGQIPLLKKKKVLFGGWRYRRYSSIEKNICKSFKFKYIKANKKNILTQFFAIEKMIYEDGGMVVWNEQPFRPDHQKFLFEDVD